MHHNFTADKCKLVGDEDGWVLEIETDEGDDLRVNIHSCAWEFAGTLDGLREEMVMASQMKAMVRAGLGPNGEQLDDGGYELNDPKHADYHDTFSDLSEIVIAPVVDPREALKQREREQRADWIDPPGRRDG